jgi:site-specific recombinase XerD
LIPTGATPLTVRNSKGRRDRTVYLSPEACAFVREWLRERGEGAGPLFCPVSCAGNVRLTRMRGESLWYILRRRLRQAGVEGISPHSLRRSFVTSLLDAGVDVFSVQKLAGHADAVTTARYDRRRETAQREAAGRLALPAA